MKVDGKKIRSMREERGYSLSEFAANAGLSVSYMSEIEKGNAKPSLKTVNKIASVLNVDETQLFVETEVGVGNKVRMIRESKGLTIAQAAEAAGISPSYLGEIERGKVKPSVKVVNKLAKVLEVSVSDIVGEVHGIGERLRDLRTGQGMTQAELARKASVSAGLIGQIENGRVQPSLETVEKIASALGVSPCCLILNEMGSEEMLRQMSPSLRELLCDENVQAVLRLLCNCNQKELQFIMNFIKLYKKEGAGVE